MSDKTKDVLLAGAVSAVSAVAVWVLIGFFVQPGLLQGLISGVAGLGLGLAVAVRRLRRRESDANV